MIVAEQNTDEDKLRFFTRCRKSLLIMLEKINLSYGLNVSGRTNIDGKSSVKGGFGVIGAGKLDGTLSVSGNIFTDGDFIGIQQTSDLSVSLMLLLVEN